MGYYTKFKGVFKIEPELKATQLAHLKQFLGEDFRDHPDWIKNEYYHNLHYSIDLQLTDDFSGLEWDGMEKSQEMVAQVNYIISQMRDICPEFKLSGKFIAQGENIQDSWELIIDETGWAKKLETPPTGTEIICPHCKKIFFYDKKKK